jgi:flagellar biosynthesis protein FlhA
MSTLASSPQTRGAKTAEIGVALAVVFIIALLVVPLPAFVLDLCLSLSIGISLVVLLVALYTTDPLEFSSFPALILLLTLFRLALNVSSTRLILSEGKAGEVIQAFGEFVVGGNYAVGVVLFLILVGINFIVITKGAGRVAEVAARFTLDAMPGKQMAIDADLSAGLIDEATARKRRSEITQQADFYGAMDGASKFVKGDAIAGLVITFVNLIGGFLIGVVQHGMSVTDAIQQYSLLTIGDGLVSQIPALLVSISAGLIVTRAAGGADLGSDVFAQFRKQRSALRAAGIVVLAMAVIPGLPKLPFLLVGITLVLVANRLPVIDDSLPTRPLLEPEVEAAPPSPQQMAVDARVDPLELSISFDLISLVDSASGGDLLDRVGALRRKLAGELGFVMPSIRTRDSAELPTSTYVIRVHGVEVGRGTAPANRVMVIGDVLDGLPGEEVREPVFGLNARWVPIEYQVQAEIMGNTVVDRSTLIVTHLAEVVRRRAGRLLSRSDVKALIDGVRASDPQVVEDLLTVGVTTGEVQRVLGALLDDGIAIRDLVRILEAIGDRARSVRTLEAMVEAARNELGPAITGALAHDNRLSVVTLAPTTENRMLSSLRSHDGQTQVELRPDQADVLIRDLNQLVASHAHRGATPVLVCSAPLRPALSRLVRPSVPSVAVVAYGELGDHLSIDVIANIDLDMSPMNNANDFPEEYRHAYANN